MSGVDVAAGSARSLRGVRRVYLFVAIGFLLGVGGRALFTCPVRSSDQTLEATPAATPSPTNLSTAATTRNAMRTTARLRVLFLGNAHTTLHDIPWQVHQLAENSKVVPGIDVRTVAEEKSCLLDLRSSGKALEAIRSGPWDYVVLQERSGDVVYQVARTHDAITRLDAEVRRQGAKTLLLVAWRRLEFGPEWSQEAWTESFVTVGQKIGARLAPVGIAWQQALNTLRPQVLYARDGFSSSPAGAYLAACTLFACLTGVSPEGLTARIPGRQPADGPPSGVPAPDRPVEDPPARTGQTSTERTPGQSEERLLVDLEPELAASLQKIAWDTVRNADALLSRPFQPVSHEQWFTMSMVYAQEGKRDAAIAALKAYLVKGGKWDDIARAGLEELGGE